MHFLDAFYSMHIFAQHKILTHSHIPGMCTFLVLKICAQNDASSAYLNYA